MKKLLTVLLVALFAVSTTSVMAKTPAPKKVVKKHAKVDGTKIADDKPTKPVAKKKK